MKTLFAILFLCITALSACSTGSAPKEAVSTKAAEAAASSESKADRSIASNNCKWRVDEVACKTEISGDCVWRQAKCIGAPQCKWRIGETACNTEISGDCAWRPGKCVHVDDL